jgi:peptide/nickel transport system permease protein
MRKKIRSDYLRKWKEFVGRRRKLKQSQALQKIVWRKILKSKQGIILLSLLTVFILTAAFGYLITPDSTPNCNEQILEIGLQKPLSTIRFLEVRKNQRIRKHHFIYRMLFGQPSLTTKIPIQGYYFTKDSIVVELLNEIPPYNRAAYHRADVCYPLQRNVPIISDKETIHFYDVEGKQHRMLHSELQQQTVKHIVLRTFVLGTDRYGRDVLSRLMIGTRISLAVGFVSVFIALTIGVFLGAIAGYFRGKTDSILTWFIQVVWSIPALLLVIAISFVLGKGFWQVFVAIGLTMWVDIARITRGEVISMREKEFVEAAKSLGFGCFTIIFKHILPNITGTLAVVAAANFASAILTEAGLSFLGMGVKPPMTSWGMMIKENYGYIILDYAYLAIAPGVAILMLTLCFMMTGNLLRDIMDVKHAG